MKKKLVAVLLTSAMAVSMVACTGGNTPAETTPETTEPETKVEETVEAEPVEEVKVEEPLQAEEKVEAVEEKPAE